MNVCRAKERDRLNRNREEEKGESKENTMRKRLLKGEHPDNNKISNHCFGRDICARNEDGDANLDSHWLQFVWSTRLTATDLRTQVQQTFCNVNAKTVIPAKLKDVHFL